MPIFDNDHTLRVRDAARRLEYNSLEFQNAQARTVGGIARPVLQMRHITFDNFLASAFDIHEVIKSICKEYEFAEFQATLKKEFSNDEVIFWVRKCRNSQVHGLDPAATSHAIPEHEHVSMLGFGFVNGMFQFGNTSQPGDIPRGEFTLKPVPPGWGLPEAPVPSKHMGVELTDVTHDVVAQLATTWWKHVAGAILDRNTTSPQFPPTLCVS